MLHVKHMAAKSRANARSYANAYLRRGWLKKEPCGNCGNPESQMHHEDYSKPLDVRWLCRPCHMAEHGVELGHRKTSCSNCDKPHAPSSTYCKEHRAEYQRGWRKRI